MTTKEYVKKFNLDVNDKFDHTIFIQDLTYDFLPLLELSKAENNLKGFNNALRCIKMKWDSINNKTVGNLPEKLWNYFYATVVVKLRDKMCAAEVLQQKEKNERKRKEYEQRKKIWDDVFNDSFKERFDFLSNIFKLNQQPIESFKTFGFDNSNNVSINDINKSYKKLVMIHHPDKGGKQENFVSITTDKNKCIQWLENNK